MLFHSLVWSSMSTWITKAVLVPVLSEVCVFGISWILEISGIPLSELLFIISVTKVTSVAHNQSIISDSLLKTTTRFWLFSQSAFPKVKSGSMALNLQFGEPQSHISPGDSQALQTLASQPSSTHFLSENDIHFLKPPNAQRLIGISVIFLKFKTFLIGVLTLFFHGQSLKEISDLK